MIILIVRINNSIAHLGINFVFFLVLLKETTSGSLNSMDRKHASIRYETAADTFEVELQDVPAIFEVSHATGRWLSILLMKMIANECDFFFVESTREKRGSIFRLFFCLWRTPSLTLGISVVPYRWNISCSSGKSYAIVRYRVPLLTNLLMLFSCYLWINFVHSCP